MAEFPDLRIVLHHKQVERVLPRKAAKSRVEPITKRLKLVEGNCAGKVFKDCVPTDDLEQLDFGSKADAIDGSGSMMNGCVVTPVYENSTGKRVLDNSSQTVYSKFKLSKKVETVILKNEDQSKVILPLGVS